MGTVVWLRRRHASSSVTRTPKIDGDTCKQRRAKTLEKAGNNLGGMRLRSFQLETAVPPTPAKSAAAALPPIASMTCSTDVSIIEQYPQSVNWSSPHILEIPDDGILRDYWRMGTTKTEIAQRLKDARLALGLNQAQLCRVIECKTTRWSQYEDIDGERAITMEIATRLKKEFGLTLDWIYLGDPSGLTQEMRLKIKAVQALAPKSRKVA